MKYDGTVIISDLDGTLLGEDRKLAEENLLAIRAFTDNGGLFGVATGRMERTTRRSFPELPVNIPSIFYNGALVYDLAEDRIIRESLMPEGLDNFFQDFLTRFSDLGLEINAKGKAYILRGNDILSSQLAREGLEAFDADWSGVPGGWYKVLLASSHERLAQVKKLIEDSGRMDITVVFSEERLLDVMARNVSKGAALDFLRLKYHWRKVAAVGDSENDLSLLKSADLGFAVGNAGKPVRKAADHILGPNSEACIPAMLKFIDETFL